LTKGEREKREHKPRGNNILSPTSEGLFITGGGGGATRFHEEKKKRLCREKHALSILKKFSVSEGGFAVFKKKRR